MTRATFQELVTHLTEDQTPRVWSLLVTVFGELAQDPQARISGALLSRLTSLMGIRPEAMRVALHRLRKDGWINSERQGRTSAYFLTDWGRAQSADATPRIYGLEPVSDQVWLVVFDPNQVTREPNVEGMWIAANLLITSSPDPIGQAFATPILPSQSIPDWMRHKVCTPELVQMTKDFHIRLSRLQAAIPHCAPLDRFEISAMRILIVDRWRRIVLRTPHLAAHVFPEDWMGQPCRDAVATLLDTYEKQDLAALMRAL